MILLVANWKAAPENPTLALRLAKATATIAKQKKKKLSFVLCVPTVYMSLLGKGVSGVGLGAQNVAPYTDAPHTGEITASMLKALKVAYCIVGHSERRHEGETDAMTAEKTMYLLDQRITPILCVGERDRDAHGWYLSTIKDQIKAVFEKLSPEKAKKIVLAYEPVWAIGKGALREATPVECREMVLFIRKTLTDLYSAKVANAVRILYGGSVDEKNAALFISEGEADGLLFGRLSLDAKRVKALCANLSAL